MLISSLNRDNAAGITKKKCFKLDPPPFGNELINLDWIQFDEILCEGRADINLFEEYEYSIFFGY